jgi:hypothetical protein
LPVDDQIDKFGETVFENQSAKASASLKEIA